jgi:hypothetical protein
MFPSLQIPHANHDKYDSYLKSLTVLQAIHAKDYPYIENAIKLNPLIITQLVTNHKTLCEVLCEQNLSLVDSLLDNNVITSNAISDEFITKNIGYFKYIDFFIKHLPNSRWLTIKEDVIIDSNKFQISMLQKVMWCYQYANPEIQTKYFTYFYDIGVKPIVPLTNFYDFEPIYYFIDHWNSEILLFLVNKYLENKTLYAYLSVTNLDHIPYCEILKTKINKYCTTKSEKVLCEKIEIIKNYSSY